MIVTCVCGQRREFTETPDGGLLGACPSTEHHALREVALAKAEAAWVKACKNKRAGVRNHKPNLEEALKAFKDAKRMLRGLQETRLFAFDRREISRDSFVLDRSTQSDILESKPQALLTGAAKEPHSA